MDVTDTGTRPEEERVEENVWLDRMRNNPPGLDARTNYRSHNDLVATAAPGPIESDGTLLGGEKERVLTGVWADDGYPDLDLYEPDVLGPANDPFDMLTPLGTPEGARPRRGEVW